MRVVGLGVLVGVGWVDGVVILQGLSNLFGGSSFFVTFRRSLLSLLDDRW